MVRRVAGVLAVLALLVVPFSRAATTDTAAPVTVSPAPGPYPKGATLSFDSPTTCTVFGCQKFWTVFTFGGPQHGQRMTADTAKNHVDWTFNAVGIYTVQLDLSEPCAGSSGRLTCDSFAEVRVEIDVPPPVDTTPPTITVTNTDVEATGPSTVVNFKVDATPAQSVVSTACSPAAGQAFPVDTTVGDCTAVDANGNVATAGFKVHVSDTTPPAVSVPAAVAVDATSPAGAMVMYTATANDLVDGPVAPTCTAPSGTMFPIGSTLVSCSASDTHGNTSNASFMVAVAPLPADAPPPPPPPPPLPPPTPPPPPALPVAVNRTPPTMVLPAPIVINATSPAGAVVRYAVLATDAGGAQVAADCSHASSTLFPIGTTSVSCTATDARGNVAAPQTFTVLVRGPGLQLADALAQVRGWAPDNRALAARLRQIQLTMPNRLRACRLLAATIADVRGPLARGLTGAERTTLARELNRVAAAAGCAR